MGEDVSDYVRVRARIARLTQQRDDSDGRIKAALQQLRTARQFHLDQAKAYEPLKDEAAISAHDAAAADLNAVMKTLNREN